MALDFDSGCNMGMDSFLMSSGVRSGGLGFYLWTCRCVPIRHGVFHGAMFGSIAVIILPTGDSRVVLAVRI